LARLLHLWPAEVDEFASTDAQRLVALIERALRAERRRGITGHWAYDISRHAALVQARAALRRNKADPGMG